MFNAAAILSVSTGKSSYATLTQGKMFYYRHFVWSSVLVHFVSRTVEPRILTVQVVSLGTLSPSSTTSLAFTAPAMQTALEEFAATEYVGVLNLTLTLLYNASILEPDAMPYYCDDMLASWYYRERSDDYDVTVIVIPGGPEDLSVNNLAKNWNILYVTCGSSRSVITDKTQSPTWVTTTAFSSSQAAAFYANIIEKYHWTSLFVVVDRLAIPVFHSAAETIMNTFRKLPGFQLTSTTVDCHNDTETLAALREFAQVSRVLLFFGHAAPLRHFMVLAHGLNFTRAEFIYIVLEPYHHNIIGDYTWKAGDSNDKAAFEAFQSVLLMAPDDPALHTGSEAQFFAARWRQMTFDEFNYTYAPEELFVPTVASSHYTMDVVAMSLKESMTNLDFDYGNGTAIAQLFYNRTFSVDGEDFFIDQFGRREVKWWSSYFDRATGQFVPFLAQSAGSRELEGLVEIVWHNSTRLPSNEPACGFLGTSKALGCYQPALENATSIYASTGLAIAIVFLLSAFGFRRTRSRHRFRIWWLLDASLLRTSVSATADP